MDRLYTRAPHRRGASPEEFAPNAALLIDFDNVTMAIRSNLAQELQNLMNSDMIRGKVAVQRAYADWRRYPQYIVPLSESSIDLIFAPAYGSSKKNATDIRLAIDALELVFTRPEIGTFILLSGDSDFSSLVLKLKEYGKYVIGVGLQESSSDILVQNCDEYYSYTSLSGLRAASEGETQRHDPWELVERSLRKMVSRDDVMRSDRLKQVMLEIDPSFDEKAAGYSKFNRFLAEAASRDKVRLRKAANGQYEVLPTEGGGSRQRETAEPPRVSRGRQERAKPSGGGRGSGRRGSRSRGPAAEEQAPPSPDAGGGAADVGGDAGGREEVPDGSRGVTASALRDAYGLLSGAVRRLSRDRDPVRDSEVKRAMLSENGDFDEAALGFRKFSRFLQQAHDEGVVDLHQGDDGNYYIAPLDGEAPAGGGGERPAPEAQAREEGEDGEERSAARARARGRGDRARDRSSGREERSAGREGRGRRGIGAGRRGPGGTAADGAAEVAVPGPLGGQRAPADESRAASTEPAGTGHSAAAAGPEPSPSEGSGGRAARRGLGRFRRGRRGGSPSGAGPTAAATGIGPVDVPGRSEEPAFGEAESAGVAEPDASAGESPPPEPPEDERGAIGHMVRNYPGVGQRTAARLVDEFGEDVFEVIDREPERVAKVLSERRAQAVIEAREAERRSGDAGGSG